MHQLQDVTGTHPSGTSHGVGKLRHSLVSGFRAGVTICAHATAGGETVLMDVNLPSGKSTLTPPTAIGIVLVTRKLPMKSAGVSGRNSLTKRLRRACAGI